jgi:formamidopyrimidine-DNA glycosylase
MLLVSMPELPEVESVRRSLEPALVGRRITGLEVGAFTGVLGGREPAYAAAMVTDRRVTAIRRRGKYLLIDLDDGSGIEIHLRMTGHLELTDVTTPAIRFQHLVMHLDSGQDVRFVDQRKFGRVIVHEGNPELGLKTKLGPEPLDDRFTATVLVTILTKRISPIKSILLDQTSIAGIGNIYADEALFRARIHPLSPGKSLSHDQIKRLHREIRLVLRNGIERGGTSFSDYRDANGELGSNQLHLLVYGKGRKGHACPRCGQPLQHLVLSGRTSHFCPSCQPPPE